jgi:hypothetical protein
MVVLMQARGGIIEEVKLKVGGDNGDVLPSGDSVFVAELSEYRAWAIWQTAFMTSLCKLRLPITTTR